MTVQNVDPGPSRHWLGWIALAILFATSILLALQQSLQGPEEPPRPFATEKELLRNTIRLNATLEEMGLRQARRQNAPSLDRPVSDIVDAARTDPAAAAVYAALRVEQGKEVPPEMLEALRASNADKDQALAEIYGSDRLTKSQAEGLGDRLPTNDPFYDIVRAHALEKAGILSARRAMASMEQFLGLAIGGFVLFGAFLLSGFLWIWYVWNRSQGNLEPMGHPLEPISLHVADALALRSAQIFVGFLAIGLVIGFFDEALPGPLAMALPGIATMLLIPWLFSQTVFERRITLSDIGLRRENLGKHIMWGVLGWVAFVPVMGLALLLVMGLARHLPQPSHPATEMLQGNPGAGMILAIFFIGAIVAPFWEEILFRGTLLPAVSRLAGSRTVGILSTSFVFAAIHPQGLVLWVPLAVVGALGALLTYQTRSLVPAMVMHAFHNGLLLAITVLVF